MLNALQNGRPAIQQPCHTQGMFNCHHQLSLSHYFETFKVISVIEIGGNLENLSLLKVENTEGVVLHTKDYG